MSLIPVYLILLLYGAYAIPRDTFNIPLDPKGEANLYWRLDYDRNQVLLEVHAQLQDKQWFGIGFSDYGEITHADLCVLWTDWKGKVNFQDTYTDDDGYLFIDKEQNCKYFQYERKENISKFSFSRKFDTCDDKDYVIEDGTTHVVWATGEGPLFSLSGLDIGSAAHGFQHTQLLKNLKANIKLPRDTFAIEVLSEKVKVPSSDTTYWCHVTKLPDTIQQKHHIVQSEAVIQPGNEQLVHHMEIFHCETQVGEEIPLYRGSCSAPDRPQPTQVCKKVLAAWAMGATPFQYPKETGLPIGGPGFNQYVMLEVHYNNPNLKDDWVDSSGLRVYVTTNLRQHDAAVIEFGLEYIDKMAIPPNQPHFPLHSYCISECTGVSLPPTGITIFGSQLHTHLTGIRILTRHIRDGRELPELNRDNHYSSHFQEIRLLKRQVKILPGDALITTCWYNTTGRSNITLGGFAISDEMCVNYVYYYPKIGLEVCKSSISDQSLQSYFRLEHEWDGQNTSPDLGISDNYKSIEWTPMRVSVLKELYQESPIYMQCNQSSGERFPGDWTSLPVTPVLYPLPPLARDCPNK